MMGVAVVGLAQACNSVHFFIRAQVIGSRRGLSAVSCPAVKHADSDTQANTTQPETPSTLRKAENAFNLMDPEMSRSCPMP